MCKIILGKFTYTLELQMHLKSTLTSHGFINLSTLTSHGFINISTLTFHGFINLPWWVCVQRHRGQGRFPDAFHDASNIPRQCGEGWQCLQELSPRYGGTPDFKKYCDVLTWTSYLKHNIKKKNSFTELKTSLHEKILNKLKDKF